LTEVSEYLFDENENTFYIVAAGKHFIITDVLVDPDPKEEVLAFMNMKLTKNLKKKLSIKQWEIPLVFMQLSEILSVKKGLAKLQTEEELGLFTEYAPTWIYLATPTSQDTVLYSFRVKTALKVLSIFITNTTMPIKNAGFERTR
jgi:hypothetical protein